MAIMNHLASIEKLTDKLKKIFLRVEEESELNCKIDSIQVESGLVIAKLTILASPDFYTNHNQG